MHALRPWLDACQPGRAFLAPCCVAVGSSYAHFDTQPGPGLPAHVVVTVGSFAAALGVNLIDHAWGRRRNTPAESLRPIGARELAGLGVAAFALAGLCAAGLVPLSGSAALGYGALAVIVGAARGELLSFVAFGPLAALAGFASQAGTGSWGAFLAGIPTGLVAASALAKPRRASLDPDSGAAHRITIALPLLAAAAVAIAVRSGEYGPWARLALIPLIVAAIATWRSQPTTTTEDETRQERLVLACAVAALGAIVLAFRIAASA